MDESSSTKKPEFRFRLNGIIVPEIRIQRALVSGKPVGELQIAVKEPTLGWFTLDNNESLWDQALPKFILEYRDETAWALLPMLERRLSKDKGWCRTTPEELIGILYSSGVIE